MKNRFFVFIIVLIAAGTVFAGGVKQAEPAPAAQAAPQLVGRLEGPQILTGVVPSRFNEAPELAALVRDGKLPTVAERVGRDPLVVQPVHEVGKYGGIWRRGFTGPGDSFNGWRAATGPDSLVFWDYTATKVVPNIAREMVASPDGREYTFHLRRGMRWSDGHPFTADDIMFWYEDMYQNADLSPSRTTYMFINGREGRVEKIDDFTVVFRFPEPYWMFPEVLAGTTTFSHSMSWNNGSFAPRHYLTQFHPNYVDKETLDRLVRAEGYDNWVRLFQFKNSWANNPELPVVTPWKTVSPISQPQWILERNPYSIWMDPDGNQLPYIDRIVMSLAENLEVLNLRAIAGEYDFQARHIALSNLPVLIDNQQAGNYRVHLDTGNYGADLVVWINLWYEEDPVIGDLLRNVDFRRAMSLGIDRQQLNETFWLGTGTPGSIVPADDNMFNPGPEYRTLWATHDRDKANELLDSIGLSARDSAGWRLRPDGSRRPLRIEILTKGAQFLEFTQMAEMIRSHWERLGIQVVVREVERALGYTMEANNETQFSLWTNDGSDNFFLWTASGLPTVFGGFSEWFNSQGARGQEPNPELRRMAEIFWQGMSSPVEERIALGQEFWRIAVDNVIQMGVVGIGAAAQGVRVTNVNMGNTPERQYCTPWVKNPAISRPVTFYWKNR